MEELINSGLQPLLSPFLRLPGKEDRRDSSSAWMIVTIVPENEQIRPLLSDIERLSPDIHLLSLKKWRLRAEELLHRDFIRLALSAALFIILLTTLFFRNSRRVVAALAPVCAALAAMVIFMYLARRDINMMHVLMGIMVIGLSVDYGIFTVCAHEQRMTATTGRAIFICAVSSCIGFGVLAFARHPALNALGTTVLVGIGAALPTSLWVTPALLDFRKNDP